MRWGPEPLAGGGTRFSIWAPGVDTLTLEIEGADPLPMTREADGWFAADTDAGPGAHYRFRLPDGTAVPDPASRGQASDVHGWSVVTDPAAYEWRETGWRGRPWTDAVIQEVHVGVLGGYAGVIDRLDAIAATGFTAIELMPLAATGGMRNWGYDGVLPYAPNAAYGTPDELKALIDAAHARGLMVFLDVVYNHFGPDGNYLPAYAADFFKADIHTPWGGAIDFGREPGLVVGDEEAIGAVLVRLGGDGDERRVILVMRPLHEPVARDLPGRSRRKVDHVIAVAALRIIEAVGENLDAG